jgi:hypothetical protein
MQHKRPAPEPAGAPVGPMNDHEFDAIEDEEFRATEELCCAIAAGLLLR